MSVGQGGLKKHGTRAHQNRVLEIVVDSYIVRKQYFWAKYFQNYWQWPFCPYFLCRSIYPSQLMGP